MKQVLTYTADTTALLAEVEEKYPRLVTTNEDGSKNIRFHKLNTSRRNGELTLNVVILTNGMAEVLDSLTTLQVMGTYEEVFADETLTALYKTVHDFTVSNGVDEEGNLTYPNKTIGSHA